MSQNHKCNLIKTSHTRNVSAYFSEYHTRCFAYISREIEWNEKCNARHGDETSSTAIWKIALNEGERSKKTNSRRKTIFRRRCVVSIRFRQHKAVLAFMVSRTLFFTLYSFGFCMRFTAYYITIIDFYDASTFCTLNLFSTC